MLAGLLIIGGVGCRHGPVGTEAESARPDPASTRPAAAAEAGTDAAPGSRFVPTRIDLPGSGARATVVPFATVAGSLIVPDDVRQVGWWDGSAQVGDPYGDTVIAGHVDSAEQGIGFFRRLWSIKVGDISPSAPPGCIVAFASPRSAGWTGGDWPMMRSSARPGRPG